MNGIQPNAGKGNIFLINKDNVSGPAGTRSTEGTADGMGKGDPISL